MIRTNNRWSGKRRFLEMRFRELFTSLIFIVGGCLVLFLTWYLWPVKPESKIDSASLDQGITHDVARVIGQPIQPIQAMTTLDPEKVHLGERLFHDPRLSKNNTIACASCHDLATAGTDHRLHSIGIDRQEGERNAPTVFNASLNYRQFWDGRAISLEDQMDGPVQAHSEMSSDWREVGRKLRLDSSYTTAFATLYPDGIRTRTIKDAIATFERSLVTPDCPFDQYLQGQPDAISEQAKQGYQLFKSYGCVSCHQGANVGGNMMQPFGVMVAPSLIHAHALSKNHRLVSLADIGLGDSPRNNDLDPLFRVPSLRNVARTAPYFHDGSMQSLREAIRIMGLSQLGRKLPQQDVNDIEAFLKSLTGKYNGRSL